MDTCLTVSPTRATGDLALVRLFLVLAALALLRAGALCALDKPGDAGAASAPDPEELGKKKNPFAAAEPRRPVPTAELLKAAETVIRERFKEDFAKKGAGEPLKLAMKLYDEGYNTSGEPALRFQLMRMALDLAAAQGGLNVLEQAANTLAAEFEVDSVALRARAFAAAQMAALSREDAADVARVCLALGGAALANDDFDSASAVSAAAQRAATVAQNGALSASASKLAEDLRTQRKSFDATKAERDKLLAQPDDPAANLAMGKYYCFARHNWARGLPFLAKSGETRLTVPAKAESAAPAESQAVLETADKWFAAADAPGPQAEKDALKLHAVKLYAKALRGLSGLSKLRVEKRLDEMHALIVAWVAVENPEPHGISEATRKALPADADLKKLRDLAAATASNRSHDEDFFDLHNHLMEPLLAAPETWSDEDFRARVEAESKVLRAANAGHWAYHSHIFDSWITFVAASPTAETCLRRLSTGPQLIRNNQVAFTSDKPEDKVRGAVQAFLDKNTLLYPTTAARKRFCDWLRGSGIVTPVIAE